MAYIGTDEISYSTMLMSLLLAVHLAIGNVFLVTSDKNAVLEVCRKDIISLKQSVLFIWPNRTIA
jgi:hypothetical protein